MIWGVLPLTYPITIDLRRTFEKAAGSKGLGKSIHTTSKLFNVIYS